MAERVGFEPTLPFRVNTLSKRAPSATRPSLRDDLRQENAVGSNSEEAIAGIVNRRGRRLTNFPIRILWPTSQNRKAGHTAHFRTELRVPETRGLATNPSGMGKEPVEGERET